jgi:hypothetical protein
LPEVSDNNVFYPGCVAVAIGQYSVGNVFYGRSSNVMLGAGCTANRLGIGSTKVTLGDYCRDNEVRSSCTEIVIGAQSADCVIGYGCTFVQLGTGCRNVRVYRTNATPANPYKVPDNTQDAVFIDGQLQTSGGTAPVLRPALRVSNAAAYPNATSQPAPNGQFLKVTNYSQVEREVGSTQDTGWDAAKQHYVVPASGEYQIAAVGQLQPGVSIPSAVFYHLVYVNDVRTRDLFIQSCPSNQEYYGGAGTTDLSLEAGDIVDIRYWHDAGEGSQLIQSNTRCAFSIRQLPS